MNSSDLRSGPALPGIRREFTSSLVIYMIICFFYRTVCCENMYNSGMYLHNKVISSRGNFMPISRANSSQSRGQKSPSEYTARNFPGFLVSLAHSGFSKRPLKSRNIGIWQRRSRPPSRLCSSLLASWSKVEFPPPGPD